MFPKNNAALVTSLGSATRITGGVDALKKAVEILGKNIPEDVWAYNADAFPVEFEKTLTSMGVDPAAAAWPTTYDLEESDFDLVVDSPTTQFFRKSNVVVIVDTSPNEVSPTVVVAE